VCLLFRAVFLTIRADREAALTLTYNWSSTPPDPKRAMDSLKKALKGVKENVLLASYTTFRIGGKARYFFVAKTKQDIVKAIAVAKNQKTPFFVLSGGSNLLVSDRGFNGLVIKIQNTKYKIQDTSLFADAGVPMETLVKETTKRGLAGFEWAGGLPGSVGGAVRGNAGAFGGEIKDAILQVECLDQKGRIRTLSKKACEFGYRSSVFKEKNLIVLSAVFHLKKGSSKILKGVAKDHVNYRKERHPLEFPNAGSIFKNCDFKKIPASLKDFVKDVVKIDPFPVVPTAFLLAKAGLKGLSVHDAQISKKHPNYIVNTGNAKASDVLLLIKKVKHIIKKKFSVDLEEEIESF